MICWLFRGGRGQWFAIFGLLASLMSSAFAQSTPAEELRRQQQRDELLRERFERTPDVRLPAPAAKGALNIPDQETPCFPVKQVVFDTQEPRFLALLKPVASDPAILGRCLGANGINAVLTYAQNILIAQGYVTTRVLAPPQDLKSGTLHLTVVPGRIREVRFADGASSRGTQWNALPTQKGKVLNLRDIEQGLENLKRSPTSDADIQITPASGDGAQPGDSDIVIQYQQAFPLRLTVSLDDSGSKYTGKYQSSTTLSFDNPFLLNDLLYITLNRDQGGGMPGPRGTEGEAAYYSIPFGYWTASTSYSHNRYYQTVAGTNQTYVYSGDSENEDVKLSYLLHRNAVQKTTVSMRGFLRNSRNFIDDTEVEVQRRRTAGWEAALAHRQFIGDSILDGSLAWRRGTGAFGALHAPEENFGEGTSRFKVLNTELNLTAPFALQAPWGNQRMRYLGTWRLQHNYTPLTPQDRFSIGNRYTVRGFDGELTLTSERGWLVRNDIGASIADTGQEIYLGMDAGEVGGRSSNLLLGKQLAGAVIGLRGGYKNVSYDWFVGTPLKKPEGFNSPHRVGGFNLVWSI